MFTTESYILCLSADEFHISRNTFEYIYVIQKKIENLKISEI